MIILDVEKIIYSMSAGILGGMLVGVPFRFVLWSALGGFIGMLIQERLIK